MNLDESDSPYELSPFGTPVGTNAGVNLAELSNSDSPSTDFDWSDEDYAPSETPKGDFMATNNPARCGRDSRGRRGGRGLKKHGGGSERSLSRRPRMVVHKRSIGSFFGQMTSFCIPKGRGEASTSRAGASAIDDVYTDRGREIVGILAHLGPSDARGKILRNFRLGVHDPNSGIEYNEFQIILDGLISLGLLIKE